MSRFLTAAATMQRLSLTAMEEASREGLREADIEHLLLALTINEQTAGQVLRDLGVTLEAARRAVAEQHASQLRDLGVTKDTEQPGRIVFHETAGYEWSRRAGRILDRATSGRGGGDAADVLRVLLQEPSGLIDRVLERLDTSPDAVVARLDDMQHLTATAIASPRTPRIVFETFIPASIDEVWALTSDPHRMPEWQPMIGAVSPSDDGRVWDATAPAARADGKPILIKPQYRRRSIELIEKLEPTRVVWRLGFPDAARANEQTLAVDLSPAAGGMQLTLTASWVARTGWRSVLGRMLRPLQRLLTWLQLMQTASAISRVYR